MCFLDKYLPLGFYVVPKKILVDTTKSCLGTFKAFNAIPNYLSASPAPYASAVSKKLIPNSHDLLTA
jgi:hypothetical protein